MRNLFAVVVLLAVALIVSPSDTGAFQGTDTGPMIENFYLVDMTDAENPADVLILENGSEINLVGLPTNWNIRMETEPDVVGSVRFSLSGPSNPATNVEIATPPYILPADGESLDLLPGNYTLTAIPFTSDGTAGVPSMVNFTVIDSPIIENFYLVDLSDPQNPVDVRVLENNDVVKMDSEVTFNWNIRVETEPD
ncbi:MAG: hypothetical protein AAGK74_08155, partial [Chloroflexota bacterium]